VVGGERLTFSGLVGPAPKAPALSVAERPAMVAYLADGFDAWVCQRRRAGQGSFLKDKRRRRADLVRDHGPVSFSFAAARPDAFEAVIRAKREQLDRSGQHDIFACGWTVEFLRRLASVEDADFGLCLADLSLGARSIAAEVGLRSGSTYHLWFPVYDLAFAKYSPGALMTSTRSKPRRLRV